MGNQHSSLKSVTTSTVSATDEKTNEFSLHGYDIMKPLGEGSYGKVRVVRQRKNGKYYALKYVDKRHAPIVIRTILEERKVLSRIRHPFICNLNFAFQDEAFYCLVLDFVDSGDLRHHLERYTFSEMTIKHWIAELACAVDYLHEHNIVHRDIKPENILMSSEGHVCLADFNIARELTCKRPVINGVSGTFNYLAPEIHRGKPYTEQVDWWALGVVFYECVYKRVPFRVRHRSEVLAVMDAGLIFPETDPPVTASCKQGICALINMEPFMRVTSAEELFTVDFFQGYDRGILEATPYIMQTSESSLDRPLLSSSCSDTTKNSNSTTVTSTSSIRIPPIYDVAYHPLYKQDMDELKHYSTFQAAKDDMRGEYQKWYSKQIQIKIERQRRQKEQNLRKERVKQRLDRDQEKIERKQMLENVPQVGIKRAVNINKLFEENKKLAVNVNIAEIDGVSKKHKKVDEEHNKENRKEKKEDVKEKKKKKNQNKTGLSTKLSKLGAGRVLVVSLAMMKKNAELKRNSRRHEKEAVRFTEQLGEHGESNVCNEKDDAENSNLPNSRASVPRNGPRDVTPICNQPIKIYQQKHRQYLENGYYHSSTSKESINSTGNISSRPSINVPKCPHEEGMEPRAPQVLKHKLDIQRNFEPFDYRECRECRCGTIYCELGVHSKRLEERSLEVLQLWEDLNKSGEGVDEFSESESEVSSSINGSGSDTTAVNDGPESQTGLYLGADSALRKSRSAIEASVLVQDLKPIKDRHTKNSHSCGEIVTAAIERLAAQSGAQLTVCGVVNTTSTTTANMTAASGTSNQGSTNGRRRVPGGQQQHFRHGRHRGTKAVVLPTKLSGSNSKFNSCRGQRLSRATSGNLRSSYEDSTGLPMGVLGVGQQGRVII